MSKYAPLSLQLRNRMFQGDYALQGLPAESSLVGRESKRATCHVADEGEGRSVPTEPKSARQKTRLLCCSMQDSRRYSGFTLVELLVAIAITSLLAAILFPVFGRARETARRTSCQSNLKQIGLGMLQYAQDYDDYQPKPNFGTTSWSFKNTGNYKWMDAIYPYIKSDQVFACPSDAVAKATPYVYYQNSRRNDGGSSAWGSYAINKGYYLAGSDETHGPSSRHMATIAAPATTVWVVEQHAPEFGSTIEIAWQSCAQTPGNGGTAVYHGKSSNGQNYMKTQASAMVERHLNTSNILFCDGHVKAMRLNDVTAEKPVALKTGTKKVMTFFTIQDD